jgi:site-specific DNA-methyltransferase (adenine-specific)
MDMSQFEFDINLGKDVEDDDFEVELPDEPVSQRGDVYLLGKHRVMCGDATNAEDMKILCGSTLVDLSLTDPPYNVNIGLKGEAYEKREDSNRFKNRKLLNDNLSDAEFLKFLTDAFQNMHDYSKQGAAIYVFHADSEGYNFRKAFKDAGYDLKQTLIWMKNSLVLGRQDYQWMHEPILYGWKSGASHSWYGDRKQTTVLKYDRPLKSAEHPTMKPIELCGYLIKNSSKEGDVVLDPFGGSGSTMISCEQLNRTCYMMELDPKYVDVIIERYEKFTGQKAVKVNYEGGDLV